VLRCGDVKAARDGDPVVARTRHTGIWPSENVHARINTLAAPQHFKRTVARPVLDADQFPISKCLDEYASDRIGKIRFAV
jgi:hypothetical protein